MKKFLLITFFLIQVLASQAQDSLTHYLNRAMERNPEVLQKYYEYQAAVQKVPQAGGLPDPELTLGVFLSPMEVVNGSQVANIQLMQMFPWFGVLKNARHEMTSMAASRSEALAGTKSEIIYQMNILWLDIFKIRQNIKFRNRKLEILSTEERLITAGLVTSQKNAVASLNQGSEEKPTVSSEPSSGMSGMGKTQQTGESRETSAMSSGTMASASGKNLSDLYKIQIDKENLQEDLKNLTEQELTMTARFNSYMDRNSDILVITPDSIIAQIIDTSTLFSDSLLMHNPMLNMLKNDLQSLEARKKMAAAMGYPMIGVGLDYSLINKSEMSSSSMNGKDMLMPMVKVTLPIYRKKYNASKLEADYTQQATANSYRSGYLNLQNDFRETVQFYNEAQRKIALYKKQLEITDKILRIAVKSLSAGGAELQDILLIRTQKIELEQSLTEALVDNNKAIAKINLIKGSKN
jgi:hypothetical protein